MSSDCPYSFPRCFQKVGDYTMKCEQFDNPELCPEYHKLRDEKRASISNRTNQRKL